jgi:hypothetical protein
MARALAEAAERLKAARTGGVGDSAPESLTADDALGLLRTVCTELRDTDLEVRGPASPRCRSTRRSAGRRPRRPPKQPDPLLASLA